MKEENIKIDPRAKAINRIYDTINEICEKANLPEEEKYEKRTAFMEAALDEFDICVDEAANYARHNKLGWYEAMERLIIERDKQLCASVEQIVKNTEKKFGEVYLEQFIKRGLNYHTIRIKPAKL